MNMCKIKVMTNRFGRELQFMIGNEVLEVVREYTYLGGKEIYILRTHGGWRSRP